MYTPQLYYDYDETAIASWYGPGFHGKQKANGEIFDQDDISAAHKTLPLPTVVKVTNLNNGRMLTMIVDDRGPYVDNRIIDLSKGAAKKLGVYQRGTARVRVQSLPEESHALSMHLARIGNRWGAVRGKTWREVYLRDIAHKFDENAYEKGSTRRHPVPGYAPSKPIRHDDTHKATKHTHEAIVPLIYPQDSRQGLEDLIAGHVSNATPSVAGTKLGPSTMPVGKSYFIQLATFVQRPNAQKLVDEIGGLAQAKIVQTTMPSGQQFYAVKCGPFPNRDAAEIALTSLDVFGHNPALVEE